MEIIPGIHQLKLPLKDNPLGYINAYLLQSTEGWVLIDTGWYDEESFEAFSGHLRQMEIDFKEIDLIVCTHIHPDHFGLAGRLRQVCEAKLALGEVEKVFIDSASEWGPTLFEDMNQWILSNGVPEDYLKVFNQASSEAFKLMVPAGNQVLTDLRLDTWMLHLRQVFTSGECHLEFAIRVELNDVATARPLGARLFSYREPCDQASPQGGMRAANRIVGRFLQELQTALAQMLRR